LTPSPPAPATSPHQVALVNPASSQNPRLRRLRKDLRASTIDGGMFNLMVGMGETYLPAFVLAMGLGEIAAGMVVSIPLLVGATLQLISPWAVARLGSYRSWVTLCAATQGCAFLPLAAMAWHGRTTGWELAELLGVYVAASLYWGAGLAAGPAWNSWMETVIPLRVRASFFAWRSRLGQAGLLLGFVGGGLLLDSARKQGQVLPMFALLFTIAAVCRLVSARYLARHSERPIAPDAQQHVSIGELCRRIGAGRGERVLLFFLAMQWAVQISGPYFNPYMLGQIRISYFDYMLLMAASFCGKIVALPACGKLAYRYGTERLLLIGAIGIFPLAGMWLYADDFPEMLLLQFVGGVTWAAYELATLLTFFERVRSQERTSILTLFNFLHSAALVAGSLVGGLFLQTLGKNPEAYLALFALSSIVRAGVLAWMWLALRTPHTSPATSPPVPASSVPEP
jgi:MFS family permease